MPVSEGSKGMGDGGSSGYVACSVRKYDER